MVNVGFTELWLPRLSRLPFRVGDLFIQTLPKHLQPILGTLSACMGRSNSMILRKGLEYQANVTASIDAIV